MKNQINNLAERQEKELENAKETQAAFVKKFNEQYNE